MGTRQPSAGGSGIMECQGLPRPLAESPSAFVQHGGKSSAKLRVPSSTQQTMIRPKAHHAYGTTLGAAHSGSLHLFRAMPLPRLSPRQKVWSGSSYPRMRASCRATPEVGEGAGPAQHPLGLCPLSARLGLDPRPQGGVEEGPPSDDLH